MSGNTRKTNFSVNAQKGVFNFPTQTGTFSINFVQPSLEREALVLATVWVKGSNCAFGLKRLLSDTAP